MRGSERCFVDTNVLLYAVDPADPAKQRAANGWLTVLWETGLGCLSWQVLNEFYVNAVRKGRTANRKARRVVEVYATWPLVELSLGTIQRAWHWMDAAQLSYWDALIVAAAERGGCDRLLTEDLQHGQRLGALTVVNPFLVQPAALGFPSKLTR